MSAAEWRLTVPPADADQMVRLAQYRRAHPGVSFRSVGYGGAWQASFTEDGTEIVITRYLLCNLLDALEKDSPPGGGGNPREGLPSGGEQAGDPGG